MGDSSTARQLQEKAMDRTLYEIPKNCDFLKISNIRQRNECTPKLLDNSFFPFVGILINGPEKVIWQKNASLDDYPPSPFGETFGPLRLMVAGLIKIKYSTMGLNGSFGSEVLLVAVNQESAEVYSGKMAIPEPLPAPEPDFPQPQSAMIEEDREAPVASVFNLDLVSDLNLPILDATYTVYATFGEYKSNVLKIETKVE